MIAALGPGWIRLVVGLLGAWVLSLSSGGAQAASGPDQVIEQLGPRVGVDATGAGEAARLVAIRRAIEMARTNADARLLGQAQGLIGSDWGNPRASAQIKLLQATIEQHRHAFDEALATLKSVIQQEAPGSIVAQQAWLTIAVIERVQGRYPLALEACRRVESPATSLYRDACLAETESLQGHHAKASQRFQFILKQAVAPQQHALVRSLMGEHEARQGRALEASRHYAASLLREPDHYTAVAYSDLLLAMGRSQEALQVLRGQPETDAVMVRHAIALKRLGMPKAREISDTVQSRFDEQTRREPGRPVHLREQALFMLLVKDDPGRALALAQDNLKAQREPTDWWIALSSAKAAKQPAVTKRIVTSIGQQGLHDRRLGL